MTAYKDEVIAQWHRFRAKYPLLGECIWEYQNHLQSKYGHVSCAQAMNDISIIEEFEGVLLFATVDPYLYQIGADVDSDQWPDSMED